MANITIQNALQQERTAALPKFISPPIFNPSTGNATTFLETYERTAIANGWDNVHKINFLPLFLEGPARSWYKKYCENVANLTKTWNKIKEDFVQEFAGERPKVKLNIRFNVRMQQPEEDIRHYYYDLLGLAEELDPAMPFERFQQKFESGLHSTYYDQYFYAHEPVTNLESLKKIVFHLSAAKEKMDLIQVNRNFLTIAENTNQNSSHLYNFSNAYQNYNSDYRGRYRKNDYRGSFNENDRRQQNYANKRNNRNDWNRFHKNQGRNYSNRESQLHYDYNSNRHNQNTGYQTYTNRQYRFGNFNMYRNPRKCYVCRKVGHFARDCYFNNREHRQEEQSGNKRSESHTENYEMHAGDVLLVNGVHNGKKIKIIMDTGSNKNIVRLSEVPHFKVDKNSKSCIATAGGNNVRVLGSTTMRVTLGEKIFNIETLVIDKSNSPLILGNDFFKKYEAVFNYREEVIELTSKNSIVSIPFYNREHEQEQTNDRVECNHTTAKQETKIEEREETVELITTKDYVLQENNQIGVNLRRRHENNSGPTLENTCERFTKNTSLLKSYELYIAEEPVKKGNMFRLQVRSLNAESITIPSGTSLGSLVTTGTLKNKPAATYSKSEEKGNRNSVYNVLYSIL